MCVLKCPSAGVCCIPCGLRWLTQLIAASLPRVGVQSLMGKTQTAVSSQKEVVQQAWGRKKELMQEAVGDY